MSRELRPCGTVAAYRRHIKAGEPACEACLIANRAQNTRYWRSRAAGGLPSHAPEGAHLAPCFGNPGPWDERGEFEAPDATRARWREAAQLCLTACPVFEHCRESAELANGRGVWAGRVPERVS